jgi:hypothetical protein
VVDHYLHQTRFIFHLQDQVMWAQPEVLAQLEVLGLLAQLAQQEVPEQLALKVKHLSEI